MEETRVLLKHKDVPNLRQFEVYCRNEGYEVWRDICKNRPDAEEIVKAVKDSGLRGRGGAGFPTGMKWSFLDPDLSRTRYLVVNGDESEPGACKDAELMRENPHQLLEGLLVSCYAIRSSKAFIYIRGELEYEARILNDAIDSARAAGLIGENILGSGFNCDIVVHRGAGAYICGEETALLDSLEGRRGHPRAKPPFPAVSGLYGMPTIVNNVETISNVHHIWKNGAAWYRQFGTEKSPGVKVFSVSGNVERPGNYEFPLGVTIRELIYDVCGGIQERRGFKACIPGGSSVPLLDASKLDTRMTYEDVAAAGSMLGTATMIVIDDTQDLPRCIYRIAEFYRDESCGKCVPCREGTYWITRVLHRILHGEGEESDLDLLLSITDNMDSGECFCPLGDAACPAVQSAVRMFREDFMKYIRGERVLAGTH